MKPTITVHFPYPHGRADKCRLQPQVLIRYFAICIKLDITGIGHGEKLEVSPSYAVNPPAVQYFKAQQWDWSDGVHRPKVKDTRLKEFTDDIFEIMTRGDVKHRGRWIRLVPRSHLKAVLLALPKAIELADKTYAIELAKVMVS